MSFVSELTVVTPTIPGREDFLEVNKKSVANQTVGALPHLVMLDVNARGPAAIRNELVRQAETEWVVFLDDDDWLEYDYYETVAPYFDGDFEVVYTWCKRLGFSDNLDRESVDGEALRVANFIPVTACVRVDTFRDVGGFPEAVAYEDWALWVAILDRNGEEAFKVIPEKKWTYRRHAGSRTPSSQHAIATGKLPAR